MSARPQNSESHYSWICAGCVLLAIGLTLPVAESGVIDDWSYTKTAHDLAESGHLVYNGWASAMIGAQAYWGALFIKLFGFSFIVVRLSVAPLAAASAVLIYGLHRRANLAPRLALFGTLTVVLSPVFITNAATFMTDIPGLLLFTLSIHGYVRAAEIIEALPSGDIAAAGILRLWGWILLGLAAGLLGGTVRQVVWLVPIVSSGFLLVRYWSCQSKRIAVLAPLLISGLLGANGLLYCLGWFIDQSYAIHDNSALSILASLVHAPVWLIIMSAVLLQTLGAMILPLLVTVPVLFRQRLAGLARPWVFLGSALGIAGLLWLLASQYLFRAWILRCLGPSYSAFPYMYAAALAPAGEFPETVPPFAWGAVNLTITFLVGGVLVLAACNGIWPRPPDSAPTPHPSRIPAVMGLLAIFSAAYGVTLLIHGLMPHAFGFSDRYLLPVLPLATMGMLTVYRRWSGRDRLPLASWCVLAICCYYGVASAHDYFAQLRARVTVTGQLEKRGIPRTSIMAGFEYDGWTQLSVTGYYNDPRIKKPEGAYTPRSSNPGFKTIYTNAAYTPAIQPNYVVALAEHPDLRTTDLPPVDYHCWLPPFRRHLIVQVNNPALISISELPVLPNGIGAAR